jgi:hypothetical protein
MFRSLIMGSITSVSTSFKNAACAEASHESASHTFTASSDHMQQSSPLLFPLPYLLAKILAGLHIIHWKVKDQYKKPVRRKRNCASATSEM